MFDHWEDGYDADPMASPGATTEVATMAEGEVQVLNNVIRRSSRRRLAQP